MKKQRGFIEGGVVFVLVLAVIAANASTSDSVKKAEAEKPAAVATK